MPKPPAFIDEPMPPLRLYFSLRGRLSRRQFWRYGVATLLGLSLLGHALLDIAGFSTEQVEASVNLALLWPAVAVSVKRWHDRGRSAWWVLINLLPVVGWLWALGDNGFVRGTPGPNAYGEEPLSSAL